MATSSFVDPPAPHRASVLARFAVTGFAANLAYAVIFLAAGTATRTGPYVIHLSATVVATLVANELHRRYTFGVPAERFRVRAHTAGTATALVGLCTTTATLAVWNLVAPHAGRVATLGVLSLATGAVGLVNFGVLNRVIGARAGARQVAARQPAGSA